MRYDNEEPDDFEGVFQHAWLSSWTLRWSTHLLLLLQQQQNPCHVYVEQFGVMM